MAQRLFIGLSFFDLALVVSPAFAVAVSGLGDCRHVDGVVEPAVAPPGQPEDLVTSRRDFDRRGAVVSGEVVPVGKAADINDVAEHGASHVRPDTEDLGERGARRFDRHLEALFGLPHLSVDAAQVGQEVHGELVAGGLDRSRGLQGRQGTGDLSCSHFLLRMPAGDQVAQQPVQAADHLSTQGAQVPAALGPQLQYSSVILSRHGAQILGPERGDGH
jgi:hypothetical protein